MLNSSIVISPLVLFCFQGRLIKQFGELITFFLPFQEPPRSGTLCDFTENSLHRLILFHVLFGPEAFTLGVAAFNIPATGIEIFVPRKRSDDIAVSLSNQSPSLFIINIGCNIPANIG